MTENGTGLLLAEFETDFDIQRNVNRYAVPHGGPEVPLLESLNSVFVETKTETTHNALDLDCTVFANNYFEDDRSLITGFLGLLGVLWLNALDDGRRCYALTYVVNPGILWLKTLVSRRRYYAVSCVVFAV